MSALAWAAAAAVAAAGAVGLAVYARQGRFVFRPTRAVERSPADLGLPYEDVWLSCADGVRVHAWWVKRHGACRAALFLHGTTGNLSSELRRVAFLAGLGLDVLALDYPGYGRSQGTPSASGCLRAAQAAFEFLRAQGFAPGDVIVYGWSLGSSPAAALAARERVGGLVLHGAFTSLLDLVAERHPRLPLRPFLRAFMRVRFECLEHVRRFVGPVLVLHATEDDLIPLAHARRLFAAAPGPRTMVVFPGSHDSPAWLVAEAPGRAWRELAAGRAGSWPSAAAGSS